MDIYKNHFGKGCQINSNSTSQQGGRNTQGKQFAKDRKLAYFFRNKSNSVNNFPKMFVSNSLWGPPDSYLAQVINSQLNKLDVLLNKIHITTETPNLSDLEPQALINLIK